MRLVGLWVFGAILFGGLATHADEPVSFDVITPEGSSFHGPVLAASIEDPSFTAPALDVVLSLAHQWPAGDLRDDVVQTLAGAVKRERVRLEVSVFPGEERVSGTSVLRRLRDGDLDMAIVPLIAAGDADPLFEITHLPVLVRDHDHAQSLSDTTAIKAVKARLRDRGILVLVDLWIAGALFSSGECLRSPADVRGLSIGVEGAAFQHLITALDADSQRDSSPVMWQKYIAGDIDAGWLSTSSIRSFGGAGAVGCVVMPDENALWFMYQPVLVTEATIRRLLPGQRQALVNAAGEAAHFARQAVRDADRRLRDALDQAGGQVAVLTDAEIEAWRLAAERSAYSWFRDIVPDGDALIASIANIE